MTEKELECWMTDLSPMEEKLKEWYELHGGLMPPQVFFQNRLALQSLEKWAGSSFHKLSPASHDYEDVQENREDGKRIINFQWDHSKDFFRLVKHPNYFPKMEFSGDFISMGYMLKGTGIIWHRYKDKEERISLQEGDFFAFAPESVLMNEIYGSENILLDVSMSADVYKNYFFNAMGRGGLTEFMVNMVCQDTMPGYILYHTHADEKIRQLFYWAMLEHLQESEEAYDLVALYMGLIFANMQKYYSQDAEMHFAGRRSVGRMPEFYAYLQAHCADFSLEAMALHFHFSASYISRCFKKYAGKTIRDILIDLRMERAEKMLRNTDMGISEIAELVGYQDTSYFIEMFKAKRQVTPFRFRKYDRGSP